MSRNSLLSTPLYVSHLATDPILSPVVESRAPFVLERRDNIALRLTRSIMGQQLSTKVADIIYQRFLDLFEGDEPTSAQILEIPFDELRGIGLSNAKTNYVRNVAEYALEHGMSDRKLHAMDDSEVMEFLLPIKGVGKWTIEMLLMFTLGREDVFSVDDLGIQTAMAELYGFDRKDKKNLRAKMTGISAHWSPYRTYACLYLWDYKDTQ